MRPHPAAIKMELEAKLQALGARVVGLHSVTLEGRTAYAIFDISPDEDGNGLWFEFQLPTLVSRTDVRAFSEWLASSGYSGTVH